MFEYLGQLVLSFDLFGLGAFVPLISLSVGIGYLISEGRVIVLALTVALINYIYAVAMFVVYEEKIYFILTTIAVLITLAIPDGWGESKFRNQSK